MFVFRIFPLRGASVRVTLDSNKRRAQTPAGICADGGEPALKKKRNSIMVLGTGPVVAMSVLLVFLMLFLIYMAAALRQREAVLSVGCLCFAPTFRRRDGWSRCCAQED